MATVPFGPEAEDRLAVAAVHLESSSDPTERCRELAVLLDALETYADGHPILIGGDLNTCSASPDELVRPGRWEALLADDGSRFIDPVAHEPLFAAAASRGYSWRAANVAGPTTRWWSGSRRWRYAMRLDWILTRDVSCTNSVTMSALEGADPDRPISDHDLVAVTVARRAR
jgi:endonuclease/exonuclease/phosphatase family metal-dependent hydrolase